MLVLLKVLADNPEPDRKVGKVESPHLAVFVQQSIKALRTSRTAQLQREQIVSATVALQERERERVILHALASQQG